MAQKPQKSIASASTGLRIYSYKPHLIGAVIKTLAKEKHITPSELAKRVGVDKGNVYRLFKARYMAIPMLFKMSEALGENLLFQYHPNLKPLPNPLELENAQLKEQLLRLNDLSEENKVLKAQLDVLREVMKGR